MSARSFQMLIVVLALALPERAAAAAPSPGPATDRFAGSSSCRECHAKFYELWSTSFHGLALQPFTAALGVKLPPQTNDIKAGKFSFRAYPARGLVAERGPEGTREYAIKQVAGGKNVFYFMTLLERGWLQVLPVAYDVNRKEWFDTTASAVRHFMDRRDEALYWKERQLTFNTSCFNCHVSQLAKNYDLKTDSYRTTWAEPGINCETCHGPSAAHVQLFKKIGTNQPAPADMKLIITRKLSTAQRNDMCSPCHAKMSPVTDSFAPGDRYFDHFDLVALESPDFYPDGRDLGENYTATQWRMSPCAASGKLDCIYCHTSSGRYRFKDPATANNACLPCHEERVTHATAHTHHAPDSAGNRCISCHMPTTEFARMRRTDHSMLPPTPAATIAYKSPNACGLCHTNSAQWADKLVREWRPRDYQKPVLERAALLDAARKGDWRRLPDILAWLSRPAPQEIWTVSFVRLLESAPGNEKWPVLRKLASHESPLVRAGIAQTLGQQLDEPNTKALLKLAEDGYRLVRVRAASALAAVPQAWFSDSERKTLRSATAELEQSLRARPDETASHYNLGNFHMARGATREAIEEFELASKLQPEAVPPYVNAALAYNALGRNDEAERSLRRALSVEPTNTAANLNLGMLLSEMEKPAQAEQAFRAAFASDPTSAQAAYNLGVLLSRDRPGEALDWCAKAAALRPKEPRYVYTLAFYEQKAGKTAEAVRTLTDLLKTDPPHPDSYSLLAQIYEGQNKLSEAAAVYRRGSENPNLPEEARAQFTGRFRSLQAK